MPGNEAGVRYSADVMFHLTSGCLVLWLPPVHLQNCLQGSAVSGGEREEVPVNMFTYK